MRLGNLIGCRLVFASEDGIVVQKGSKRYFVAINDPMADVYLLIGDEELTSNPVITETEVNLVSSFSDYIDQKYLGPDYYWRQLVTVVLHGETKPLVSIQFLMNEQLDPECILSYELDIAIDF